MTRTLRRRNLVGGLLILLVLAFISLVFFDASIVQNVTTARYPFLYRPVRFLTDFGEGGIYFTIVILLGLFSWGVSVFLRKVKRQDPGVFSRLARWCAWALMSMLIAGIFLQILKHLIGRQRPHVSDGIEPHVFDFFTFNWHFHSMPSGHSQTVFTFTTLL